MKGTLPGAALPPLSPTAALQSVPGTSAARRRVKPRTQPAGSAARRHPGRNPREPTRRSSGAATISPSAATQRNPKTPKDKASADQDRQGQGNVGRTRLPPRFRPFSVRPPGLPAGRNGTHRSQAADTMTTSGTTPGESPPKTRSRRRNQPQAVKPGSRCSRREPPGKPRGQHQPAARTQPRPR